MAKNHFFIIAGVVGIILLFWFVNFGVASKLAFTYDADSSATSSTPVQVDNLLPNPAHIQTPSPVKAIYMTSWVAGTPSLRDHVIKLAEDTEINSIVIDIKDYTGKISFEVNDPTLQQEGTMENRIPNVADLIKTLHQKGIYVIGRVAVFQDPYFVKAHPEIAVHSISTGGIWRDRKGIAWIDPGAEQYWKYIVDLAKVSSNLGFDEINFDYIRYPSDGNMKDVQYPVSGTQARADVLEKFYTYLHDTLAPQHIVISADLFGLVTTSNDDLGIGQVLLRAAPHFDYIAPMVYPSHFADGFNGFANPAAHPYDVIDVSMGSAVNRLASSSLPIGKLRPWLQDFDLGATYGPTEVRAQIKAVYDVGLTSWMLWDPSNVYTTAALLPKP